MALTGTKSASKSKAVQGGVLALIGSVLVTLEALGKLPGGSTDTATAALGGIITGLGSLWSIFGSLTRKDKIVSLF